jgi:ELWxxDGT repeat protein
MFFWTSQKRPRRGTRQQPGTSRFRRLLAEPLEPRLSPAGDITTGLVHYWSFDETTGDVAQDSVGGADGALQGWTADENKWVPGRVGGALEFDTPDNAVLAAPAAMSGSYAVSFWIDVFDRSGTNPRILTARNGNEIVLNNDSNKSVGYYYSGTRVATADPSVPTFNTWEQYVINFNTVGQGIVYHNGKPTAIGGFVDSASLATWVIGHSTDLANRTDSFHGAIDDLRVYNRVLTDEDIALLAAQGTPQPTHSGPIHEWTFDETSGNTAHDIAGAADGTLLNWNGDEPQWVPGKIGGALAFSSPDDVVVTPPATVQSQWTVTYWVSMTAKTGTNPRIIGPQDGRELWAYIDLEHDGGSAFMSHNTITSEPAALPLNSWEFYAITYDTDANTATIYHNGVAVATGVFHDNAVTQPWVIGHNCDLGNNNDSLNGLLDDLRVYDRPLSLAEIQQLAAGSAPPTTPVVGAEMVTDINPGAASSDPGAATIVNGIAYFAATNATSGTELWRTDGTTAGTWLVKDVQLGPGSSNPRSLTNNNGVLYFHANDGVHGDELWKSDGTADGTVMVDDIVPGASGSYPGNFSVVSGKLYFTASDAAAGSPTIYGPSPYLSAADSPFDRSQLGTNFWLEDFEDGQLNTPGVSASAGSVRGPSTLTDSVDADDGTIDGDGHLGHSYLVRPGSTSVTFTFDRQALGGLPSEAGIVIAGGFAVAPPSVEFFDAGGASLGVVFDPVRDDGVKTTAHDRFIGMSHTGGISMIKIATTGTGNSGLEVDHLQYGAIVPPEGSLALWTTDGTAVGTTSIVNLGFQPRFNAASVNGTLYFTGPDQGQGIELWKLDANGPALVQDLAQGAGGSGPRAMTNINGTLYFSANDGIHGDELWKSDGTADGTALVKDINPGSASSAIGNLVEFNGSLFFSANDGTSGNELWKSDGTEAGTSLVSDIRPGSASSSPAVFINVNGTLFFLADDGTHLFELWKSDGTAAGTSLVKDIPPAARSSNPNQLTNVNGTLFFSAYDGTGGFELWMTDGTVTGTTRIADINPGTASSAPHSFRILPGRVIFSADDGVHGFELWTTRIVSAAATVSVDARSNIFGAGHSAPPGTNPGILPLSVNLPAGQKRTMQFSASGQISFDTVQPGTRSFYGPDGGPEASNVLSSSGLSGIRANTYGFLVGVFLGASEPADPAPAVADFHNASNFASIAPQLNQTFFIGDGLTGAGVGSQQTFVVPDGATRLYLGFADSYDPATNTITGLPQAYDDNGGSLTVAYRLVGTPLNAAPSFVKGADQSVMDQQPVSLPQWATGISAGPVDEAQQQHVQFAITGNSNPGLFAVLPTIDAAGNLAFTPAANISGTATVSIVLKDDGGTASGGTDTSTPQTLVITVTKDPWFNAARPLDVDGDNTTAPVDALRVINYLNDHLPSRIDLASAAGQPYGYVDTSHDGYVAPNDALLVINWINAHPPALMSFAGVDTATQGNWQASYGADGYILNSGPASLPAYASLSFSGYYNYVWQASTTDQRALRQPTGSDRLAASWTGHNSASIPLNGFVADLDLTDGAFHRVAVYIVDWDTSSRTQQIDVLDAATGQVLNSQLSGPFHDGKYLVWNLRGHVQLRFTNLANGLNAVASGFFFG